MKPVKHRTETLDRARTFAPCQLSGRIADLSSRSSLLVTLAIYKALATECRRDISLLSPTLLSSLDITLAALPSDLEICVRAASVVSRATNCRAATSILNSSPSGPRTPTDTSSEWMTVHLDAMSQR
jgi:hypothetical protein